MEFLRFGSSIPGGYWGCCACCIIQNFKFDPDAKAAIQIVGGDGGQAIGDKFVGPTYRDIFWQRIRFGTFSDRDMPNHAFFAILTEQQIKGTYGKQWLAILKEAGFEFIRTVCNSVYAGATVVSKGGQFSDSRQNYIFGLIRNVGSGAIADPYTPPKEWTDMASVVPEAWEHIGDPKQLSIDSQTAQLKCWKALPKAKWLTRAEAEKLGVTVTLAGQRSKYPQQLSTQREAQQKAEAVATKAAKNAFPAKDAPAASPIPE